jgi:hypothetical protein
MKSELKIGRIGEERVQLGVSHRLINSLCWCWYALSLITFNPITRCLQGIFIDSDRRKKEPGNRELWTGLECSSLWNPDHPYAVGTSDFISAVYPFFKNLGGIGKQDSWISGNPLKYLNIVFILTDGELSCRMAAWLCFGLKADCNEFDILVWNIFSEGAP